MTRIGLLSDTHGYLDETISRHFENCDEIWHGGDFGEGVAQAIRSMFGNRGTLLRGVYGNIDGKEIHYEYPEQLVFPCEEVKVLIRHIGGSPPKYNPETKKELIKHQPQLFICGHSHILKIMYDETMHCLYMNPGAAGKQGWHKMRTIIRFVIDKKEIKNCELIELGKRGTAAS